MKSLLELYNEHDGKVSDKWFSYIDAYDNFFDPYRKHEIKLLEIGVQNGGSLELWSRYFEHGKLFVGCDINPDCSNLTFKDNRIDVVVGDANSDAIEREIIGKSNYFDIIIDDGSHTSSDIINSFVRYFSHLSEGGLFVIEDLHCSYWQEFEGGLYDPYSSMSFLKRLSDIINYDHWGKLGHRNVLLEGFSERYNVIFDNTWLSQIHSVTFLNSLCIITKKEIDANKLGERLVVGNLASVNEEPLAFNGKSIESPVQNTNPWVQLNRSPDELWLEQSKKVEDLLAKVSRMEADLSKSEAKLGESFTLLTQVQSELDRVRLDNSAILNSSTWRYTAPLRKLVTLARKAPHILKLVKPIINAQGGSLPTLRKVWNLLLREGVSGLRIRLNQQLNRALLLPANSKIAALDLPSLPANVLLMKRVLIIAELSIPQCTKYRVTQKVEMLNLLGIQANVVSWTDYNECMSLIATHSEVIFYRTPGYPSVLDLIQNARNMGLTTYWEVDDVIFDRELLAQSKTLLALDKAVHQELLNGAGLYLAAMNACDYGIASTTALKDVMLQRTGKNVYVIENALDSETIRRSEEINLLQSHEDEFVRIVYGSGTNTHNVDFEEVADALIELFEKYEMMRFRLIGRLDLPANFNRFNERIERIPFCSYDEYLGHLSACDINIAPLESSLFNDAKSNIKYLEAAALKIPSVCSAAQAFRDAIDSGVTGFLCTTHDQWLKTLSDLIENKAFRIQVGKAAHEQVMKRYSPLEIAKRQVQDLFLSPSKRNKQRILSVNVFYAPRSFGGATIVAEELNKLISHNYDVYVFTTLPEGISGAYQLRRYENAGITVFGCAMPNILSPTEQFDNPHIEKAFSQVLDAIKPDLIHFHSIQGFGVKPLDLCRQRNIPYIVTAHDAWWLCGRQFMIDRHNKYCGQEKIDARICSNCIDNAVLNDYRTSRLFKALNTANRVLMPSSFFAKLHIDNGIPSKLVQLNKNGVLAPINSERFKVTSSVRFAYVGGNTEIKGVHLVRSVFRTSLPENAKLLVVDNTLNLGFSSFPVNFFEGCHNIEIVPAYTAKNMDSFFSDVDVLLFPTQCKESFGLTVREALARNVWVIATDGGAVAEDIIHGENGFVLPFGDDGKAMTQAILNTIEIFDNIPLGERIAFPNEHIRFFEEQAEELVNIYNDVLDKHRSISDSKIDICH